MSRYSGNKEEYVVGVVSDTHGLIRPEVCELFRDADFIIHAGDINEPAALRKLRSIAPVIAVRGNMDDYSWAQKLPEREIVEIGSTIIYIIHDIKRLDIDPSAAGVKVLVSGHSHCPSIHTKNGVLYLNPGSAGPKRFLNPVSLAFLDIKKNSAAARVVTLD